MINRFSSRLLLSTAGSSSSRWCRSTNATTASTLRPCKWAAVSPQNQRVHFLSTKTEKSDPTDTPYHSTNDNHKNKKNNLSAIRKSILQAALQEVHHHGWTEEALAAATMSVKQQQQQQHKIMSSSVMGMVTVDELIGFCMDEWNFRLYDDLKAQQQEQAGDNLNLLSSLEDGLKTRLEYLIPYLQSHRWHEGMALGVRGPANALQTRAQLQEMIDILVNAASFPPPALGTTDKMALGAVYVATELHMLTDTSPEYQETWSFLAQRMQEWERLTSCTASGAAASFSSSSASSSSSSSPADALFVVSSVGSSLLGGLVSLVMNPSTTSTTNNFGPNGGVPSSASSFGSFGLPDQVWQALFSNAPAPIQQAMTPRQQDAAVKDGSHPSHYDSKTESQ